jgi:hypothetical protein
MTDIQEKNLERHSFDLHSLAHNVTGIYGFPKKADGGSAGNERVKLHPRKDMRPERLRIDLSIDKVEEDFGNSVIQAIRSGKDTGLLGSNLVDVALATEGVRGLEAGLRASIFTAAGVRSIPELASSSHFRFRGDFCMA